MKYEGRQIQKNQDEKNTILTQTIQLT